MNGKIVTKQQLAEILGKSERTLTTWQKNGMPMRQDGQRGHHNLYDTAEVISWLIQQEIERRFQDQGAAGEVYDYDAERARLTFHNANIAQLDEEIKRGGLIPADEVEDEWCDMVSKFRSKLLAVPTKAAHQFLGLSDLNEAQEILKTHVYEALQELADYGDTEDQTEGLEGSRPAA